MRWRREVVEIVLVLRLVVACTLLGCGLGILVIMLGEYLAMGPFAR